MAKIHIYFSDFFNVSRETMKTYGAFDVSLINDLPMFIDPFLLFNSAKPEYQVLHREMIDYLKFLRDKSIGSRLDKGAIETWYKFSEVKQNWLGYSLTGNDGRGLGPKFAAAVHENFNTTFVDFGEEEVPESPHFEKLTLFDEGVGRDNVSDFTTNLIKKYLLEYTQEFARQNIDPVLLKDVAIARVYFNYETQTWASGKYRLPWINNDFVLLTPQDILTKDELWINQRDLVGDYTEIVDSISNVQLRTQINSYFEHELSLILREKERKRREKILAKRKNKDKHKPVRFARPVEASEAERKRVKWKAIQRFPQLLDYYLALKEDQGDRAVTQSQENVNEIKREFIEQIEKLASLLEENTDFYSEPADSYEAALKRVHYLKEVIENNDGWRIFYHKNGQPFTRERDVHILYRLTWFGTAFDVNSEANSGRGPVDFAISFGKANKALVEFKLASNSQLADNLENQAEIYEQAHRTKKSIKVIVYYNAAELTRVEEILRQLKLEKKSNIVLIDARNDNKQSASTVKSPKKKT